MLCETSSYRRFAFDMKRGGGEEDTLFHLYLTEASSAAWDAADFSFSSSFIFHLIALIL